MKIKEVKKSIIKQFDEGLLRRKCPSYFIIEVFSINNYFEEFEKYYLLSKNFKREKLDVSFNDYLKYYLLEEDISNILENIYNVFGDIKGVYTVSRKALDRLENNNVTTFYYIEDVIFVEFLNYCLCLMIGNNE